MLFTKRVLALFAVVFLLLSAVNFASADVREGGNIGKDMSISGIGTGCFIYLPKETSLEKGDKKPCVFTAQQTGAITLVKCEPPFVIFSFPEVFSSQKIVKSIYNKDGKK